MVPIERNRHCRTDGGQQVAKNARETDQLEALAEGAPGNDGAFP